jgi:hypothetical protein
MVWAMRFIKCGPDPGPKSNWGQEDGAARIVREELSQAGWSEDDLRLVKAATARCLRQETTMKLKWMTAGAQMRG